eukprot:2033156-Amphidinium_carterae.2
MKIRTSSRSGAIITPENDPARRNRLREDVTAVIPRRMSSSVPGPTVVGMDVTIAMPEDQEK